MTLCCWEQREEQKKQGRHKPAFLHQRSSLNIHVFLLLTLHPLQAAVQTNAGYGQILNPFSKGGEQRRNIRKEAACFLPFQEAADGEPCPGWARCLQQGGASTLCGQQVDSQRQTWACGLLFGMSRLSELSCFMCPQHSLFPSSPCLAHRITSTLESPSTSSRKTSMLSTAAGCLTALPILIAGYISHSFLHSGLRCSWFTLGQLVSSSPKHISPCQPRESPTRKTAAEPKNIGGQQCQLL